MLYFTGTIRNVRYDTYTRMGKLERYDYNYFHVDEVDAQGIVDWDDSLTLGYAKWVSPKRTRSYPFSRLYKIYHLPKKVAIIPIMKDEGYGGDLDHINFITFSWMNLTNIYVILAWYEHCKPHRTQKNKITAQRFDNDYIRQKLYEVSRYQQSALHWNTMHFEQDFSNISQRAIRRYRDIESSLDIPMHSFSSHEKTLQNYLDETGHMNIDKFREFSLQRSQKAAYRETQTDHALEILQKGSKAIFYLENMLGGEYYLTADEVFYEKSGLIIQESKNATRDILPKYSDIQDGLFKLILFANLDRLYLNQEPIDFSVRLKLTGKMNQSLKLPTSLSDIEQFVASQQLTDKQHALLQNLNSEAEHNPRLTIELGPNYRV